MKVGRAFLAALAFGALLMPRTEAATWLADGAAIFHAAEAIRVPMAGVRRLASTIDGGAWGMSSDRLVAVSPLGTPVADIDLASAGYGRGHSLAVDPYDDSVWIVTDAPLLLHFSRAGNLVDGTSLPATADAVALGLDRRPRVMWNGGIAEYSQDARFLNVVPLSPASSGASPGIAVDSLNDRLWIVIGRRLMAVDREGVIQADFELPFFHEADTSIVNFDDERGSIVVQTAGELAHVSRDGVVVDTSPLAPEILASTPAPIRIEPALALIRPPSGGATYDVTAAFTLRAGAVCNGSHCELPGDYVATLKIDATMNGMPMPDTERANGTVIVTPRTPMHLGTNELSATAVDRFGHATRLQTIVTVLQRETTAALPNEIQPATSEANPVVISKAANKAPSVALTAPVNGATFSAGTNIVLTATASDSDGTVAKVEFYRGGSLLLGTATTAPYQVIWQSVSPGSYVLSAKAYDNKGAATASGSATISVTSNQPPAVALTSPMSGAFFGENAAIALAATASDPDGIVARVEFLDGGGTIGATTTAPFAMTWTNALAGAHSIAARAIDDKGAVSVSTTVDIVVGQAPVVVVKSPVACSTIDGPVDLVLAADAISTTGSIARVDFYDGSMLVGTAYSAPWMANLAGASVGSHSITARAIDDRGTAATSRPATVTVQAANRPPIVAMTAPIEGSRFVVGSTIALAASASDVDGTITAVEYRIGGTGGALIGRATNPPYSVSWTNVSAGSYTLVAVAFDDRNASSASVPIHVTVAANVPPSVALTAPAAGTSYTAPAAISIAANAADVDGSIARVEFFAGSTLIGASAQPPYAVTWSNVAAGSYSITVRAIDDLGSATVSAGVPVTVADNVLPTVALIAPAAGTQYVAPAAIALTASAADSDGTIARVEFYAGSAFVGSSTSAPYGVVLSASVAGSYSLTARAIDNAGGIAVSIPVTINVTSNAAPAVTLTTPSAGAHYFAPATIPLSANAGDSDGSIARVDFYANGALIGTAVSAPYAVTWNDVPAAAYSLSAVAIDNTGATTTSDAVGVEVAAGATIEPAPGLDGSTSDDDTVVVSGTFVAPPNSGVLVNGLQAQVDADRFYANGVPLTPGANPLTITVVSQDGQVATKSITVTSSGLAPFGVVVTPTEGLAPLSVTFEVTNRSGTAFQRIEFDFDTNGVVDYTALPAQFADGRFMLTVGYPAGTSASRITVYDANGLVIQSTNRIITARTAQQQDALIRSVYDEMLGRLRGGRIAAALSAITGDLQDKYNGVFTALGGDLSAVIAGLGALNLNWYRSDHAEYVVIRDTPDGQQAFPIDFIRGQDGIWRIHAM